MLSLADTLPEMCIYHFSFRVRYLYCIQTQKTVQAFASCSLFVTGSAETRQNGVNNPENLPETSSVVEFRSVLTRFLSLTFL